MKDQKTFFQGYEVGFKNGSEKVRYQQEKVNPFKKGSEKYAEFELGYGDGYEEGYAENCLLY